MILMAMHRNIVTLSDKNYLKQGILMYKSLMKYNKDFTLHYLCLDDEAYKTMWSLPNVVAYRYDELKDLPDLKNHRESHTWEQHCWCLASYFM